MNNTLMLDLSFLSITRENDNEHLAGNGDDYISIPEVGAKIIKLFDGTRTVKNVTVLIKEKENIEVDGEDFIKDLESVGFLEKTLVKKNIFDRIKPSTVSWLFSMPIYFISLILFLASILLIIEDTNIFPKYSSIPIIYSIVKTNLNAITISNNWELVDPIKNAFSSRCSCDGACEFDVMC